MVWVPAGRFAQGRDVTPHKDQTPRHWVSEHGFFMDATLTTVSEFRVFVTATNFRTTAERRGNAMVAREGMADWVWEVVPGASWRAPLGPGDATFGDRDDLPVVSVSWDDAVAYCAWRGARLPTEAEWERAMRAGRDDTRFPWGDDTKRPDGSFGLNFWQGEGHEHDTREDGWTYVSPVRQFPPNAFGLYDPVGNVWQWTADWYAADTYAKLAAAGSAQDPTGPASGSERVTRGGSWWCSHDTCSGYGLYARGKNEPEAAFPNVGFRCVRDGGAQ
jgi:formylglycine-generating enzyme required for sulfatase activity